MEVVFIKTCVTIFGKYVKGRKYTLESKQAKQFIKEGLAATVKKESKARTRKKTTAK